ncbi:MAG: HEPN domain-containing protein [Mucilaginibacter sp.]|uniref:HEPN domain-containing protein n=1 Tax=Mucilaginibacter sp. TaxID=1882438 RepID=UPI00319FB6C6
MRTETIKLTEPQHQELQEIAKALLSQYQIEKIICFAVLSSSDNNETAFADREVSSSNAYYLLVLTAELVRIEYAMQDYISKLFPGTLVIAHGQQTVMDLVYKHDRFFLHACLNGALIFTADGFTMNPEFEPKLIEQVTSKDREAFKHIYNLATGFMECGFDCYEKGFYNNVTFVLHQAVEHGCRALIRLFTGYHSDIHNLTRLLDFCKCFSQEPAALFRRHFEPEKKLFGILAASYSEARYRDNYSVSKHDANELCSLVKTFLDLVRKLSGKESLSVPL